VRGSSARSHAHTRLAQPWRNRKRLAVYEPLGPGHRLRFASMARLLDRHPQENGRGRDRRRHGRILASRFRTPGRLETLKARLISGCELLAARRWKSGPPGQVVGGPATGPLHQRIAPQWPVGEVTGPGPLAGVPARIRGRAARRSPPEPSPSSAPPRGRPPRSASRTGKICGRPVRAYRRGWPTSSPNSTSGVITSRWVRATSH